MKVSAEGWVTAAREALICEGLAGIKGNRLAKKLGVTRGGFYYHFKNQEELHKRLLQNWLATNNFLPDRDKPTSPSEAAVFLERVAANLISEDRFSPAFEQAIREWARIDPKVRKVVDKQDDTRIIRLKDVFIALGCETDEATVRAKVFYFHQMGFYALGFHKKDSREERIVTLPIYLGILCGNRYIDSAVEGARKWL